MLVAVGMTLAWAQGAWAAQASFGPPTSVAVGAAPASTVIADLNGDGKRDLVSANSASDNVSVLLGHGDGSFAAAFTAAVGQRPVAVAVGDLNGDGRPDLATTNQQQNNGSVLLGRGDGSFDAAITFAAGFAPSAIAGGDLDGDGKRDLVVANLNDNVVLVLLGRGDGTFIAPISLPTGGQPASLVVADLNGDGKPDLVTANQGTDDVSVLLGSGDGSFDAAISFAVGAFPRSVVVGDLNADGKPDLATANSLGGNVSVLLGNGDGSFAAATNFASPSARSVVIGDLNGDGTPDLAVARPSGGAVSILQGTGDGSFLAATQLPFGAQPWAVAAGDLNDDGKLDLAVTHLSTNSISVLLNTTGAESALFVAAAGSDSGTCASQSTPCATVSYALTQAASHATINVSGTIYDHVVISQPVTITGADAPAGSPAVLDGSNSGRVLLIDNGPVTLDNLRIQHGRAQDGGGILSDSSVTLRHTTVSANASTDRGGGIMHLADLTLIDSMVSGNTAESSGGGVRSQGNQVTVIDSTVSGNSAQGGGGISLSSGSVTLTRSTVSGNSARSSGGGIEGANIRLTASTVSGNSATFGGGMWVDGNGVATLIESTVARNSATGGGGGIDNQVGTVTLGASIVASNTGGNCATAGVGESLYVSAGYNLTDSATGAACGLTQSSDVVGADPALGPLDDNGGPTATMMPAGASALGKIARATSLNGVLVCQGADQRGVARPQPSRSSCAIGAAEPGTVLATAPAFTSAASHTVLAGVPINFPVMIGGAPLAALSLAAGSTLPNGVRFTDNGNGTGVLTGGTVVGRYSFKLQASNGISPDATQAFTLIVNEAPSLSVNDLSVTEGNAGTAAAATFTVRRSGNTGGASSATVATANGTAGAGSDYTARTATPVSFAAGETSKSVTVTVTGDSLAEADETFSLNLSSPVGATIADATGTATIVNDDPSTYLSVSDATVTEGNAGTTDALFTVRRSGPLAATSSVRVTTADGSALAGSDYTALAPTTLSFAAGEASKLVRVPVAGDTVAEADETFKASLTSAVGAVISDATGLATIVDDEAATYLSVSDASVSEGNSGSATASFTVTRSGRTTATSSVQVATANGSAAAGSDFTARASTTVTFAAGETSKPVPVSVIGDTAPEADETFSLNLTAAAGATISDAAGVATIVNDDALAYLSVNDAAVNEGNLGTSTATFTVTRKGNTSGAASFTFATANASATAGSDYTARSATTLSYAAGETTKSVVVNVTGDTVDEANETFSLNLTAAVGAVLTDTVGVATIVDDDGPVVPGPTTFVSVDDLSVTEGDAGNVGYTFTLTRSGNLAGTSSVKVATADGTAIAGSDYRAIALTTYTFAAGQASRTVQVSVTGDGMDEANETFSLALSAPVGATISDASGVLTIVDNDTTDLSVGDVSVTEGNAQTTTATFTLTRRGKTGAASSVAVATANGTATAGGDYTALAATTVAFAAGQTSRTVAVSISGDTVPEADETFSLNLSAPVGATLSDAGAIATIVDDDPPGYLSVGDISVTEGNAGPTTATFTVTRTGNTTAASSATVATANGTATAGSDFTALAATPVSFAAGQASKAVTVVITGDTLSEPNETFRLNLSAAVGAAISDAVATATIVNDDPLAYLSVDDVFVTEGNTTTSTVSFTVTRAGNTTGTSSVKVATADATATAGSDYTAMAATTLSFAPGQTTKTAVVTITGDLVVEPNETFTLNLSAPVGATISDTSGLATIVNND